MFRVEEFMSSKPITIEPSVTISQALDIMRQNNIHRLPVVDLEDNLLGLITEGMITGAEKGPTSLSIHELNYLLSKTKVSTVMERKPITIEEDALMEEATQKLLEKNIGCLPVVNKDGKVVGILTQNDVFKSFLDQFGWNSAGSRISLSLENEVGVLEALSDLFAEQSVNIRNISTYKIKDGKTNLIIKTEKIVDPEFINLLKDKGYVIEDLIHFDAPLK